MASSAIPGIFPPIVARGESYVDGSWVNPVPVSVVKSLGAKFIIAVDVSPRIEHDEKELSGFEISLKASEGSRVALKKYGINEADVSLSIDLMNVHWADFLKIDHCVREGEKTIISLIEEIKKKLFWKRLRSRLPLGGS
jgi:NTE family protein